MQTRTWKWRWTSLLRSMLSEDGEHMLLSLGGRMKVRRRRRKYITNDPERHWMNASHNTFSKARKCMGWTNNNDHPRVIRLLCHSNVVFFYVFLGGCRSANVWCLMSMRCMVHLETHIFILDSSIRKMSNWTNNPRKWCGLLNKLLIALLVFYSLNSSLYLFSHVAYSSFYFATFSTSPLCN